MKFEDLENKPEDENVAFHLVKLYLEQIARLGFKRKLDMDTVINAYFYTLDRLKHKKDELKIMDKLVEKQETKLRAETKEEILV
jgi:hypothetical protein